MASDDVLRIGLLGCGPIAQYAHLPALQRTRRVRLTAICDGAEDLLRRIGAQAGVSSLHTDYGQFLKQADIDAVLIATSDPFHVPLATEALRARKHVLVEKPLGTNVAECRELLTTVHSTGLTLQVGAMKRHDPGIGYARQFVSQNLGDILSVGGWYRDTRFRPAMQDTLLAPLMTSERVVKPSSDPRANKQHYSLVTHGAHLFDTLRYLGGEIIAVTAELAHKSGQYSWHGLLEFENGARGHFELTVKVNADWSEGYVLHGEQGGVEVKTFLPFYRRSSEVTAFEARRQRAVHYQGLGEDCDPYRRQLEAFASSILDGGPVNPDARDGLAVVALLEAVEASVESGRRVAVEALTDPSGRKSVACTG